MLFTDADRDRLTLGLIHMLSTTHPSSGVSPIISLSEPTRRRARQQELHKFLMEVDDTMEWLNKFDGQLAMVKRNVQRLESATRWIMAPVSGLPTEIVIEIFRYVHHSSRSSMSSVVLSHVCSRWRSIALDYPALWTKVDLSVNCAQYALDELARRSRTYRLKLMSCSILRPPAPICVSPEVAKRVISLEIKPPFAHRPKDWETHSLNVLIDWPRDLTNILDEVVISAGYLTHMKAVGLPWSRTLILDQVALSGRRPQPSLSMPSPYLQVLRITGMSSVLCRESINTINPTGLDLLALDDVYDVRLSTEGGEELAVRSPLTRAPKALRLNRCGAQISSPYLMGIDLQRLSSVSLWNPEAARFIPRAENIIPGVRDILKDLAIHAPNIQHLSVRCHDTIMDEVFTRLYQKDILGNLPFAKLTELETVITGWTACDERELEGYADSDECLLWSLMDMTESRWLESQEGKVANLAQLKTNRRLVQLHREEWFLKRLGDEFSGERLLLIDG